MGTGCFRCPRARVFTNSISSNQQYYYHSHFTQEKSRGSERFMNLPENTQLVSDEAMADKTKRCALVSMRLLLIPFFLSLPGHQDLEDRAAGCFCRCCCHTESYFSDTNWRQVSSRVSASNKPRAPPGAAVRPWCCQGPGRCCGHLGRPLSGDNMVRGRCHSRGGSRALSVSKRKLVSSWGRAVAPQTTEHLLHEGETPMFPKESLDGDTNASQMKAGLAVGPVCLQASTPGSHRRLSSPSLLHMSPARGPPPQPCSRPKHCTHPGDSPG